VRSSITGLLEPKLHEILYFRQARIDTIKQTDRDY